MNKYEQTGWVWCGIGPFICPCVYVSISKFPHYNCVCAQLYSALYQPTQNLLSEGNCFFVNHCTCHSLFLDFNLFLDVFQLRHYPVQSESRQNNGIRRQ